MLKTLAKFYHDEKAAVILEYGWIGFLISIVIYASAQYMGQWYTGVLHKVASNLTSS